jgi:hypothetical protein
VSNAYRLAYTLVKVLIDLAAITWVASLVLEGLAMLIGRAATICIAVPVIAYLASVPVRMLRRSRA